MYWSLYYYPGTPLSYTPWVHLSMPDQGDVLHAQQGDGRKEALTRAVERREVTDTRVTNFEIIP